MKINFPGIADQASFQLPGADLTTVQDKLQIYSVNMNSDFGAVGDGASSVEDTAAFLRFNAWATALDPSSVVELTLAREAHYMVADPRWPMNIPILNTHGNGSIIQNSSIINTLKMLLLPAYPLYSLVAPTPVYGAVKRSLIATAVQGSLTVQLLTLAEAAWYSVGETLAVASYALQWEGHAPSYRYFDYPIITAINLGTGLITLDRPLSFTHLSTNPYLTPNDYAEGRAHIEKIEQNSLWNIKHNYYDINFVKNVVNAAGAIVEAPYCTGREINLINCNSDYILSLVSETNGRYGCRVYDDFEFDKMVSVYDGKNNIYDGIVGGATSFLKLTEQNTIFANGYSMCPRVLQLDNCSVSAPAQTDVRIFGTYGFMEQVSIQNGANEYYPDYSIIHTQTNTIVDGAAGVAWSNATGLLTLDFTVINSVRQFFLAQSYPGAIIAITENVGGQDLGNGIFGVVAEVLGTGNGTCTIRINFNADVPAGSQFTIYAEPWKVDYNGRNYAVLVKDNYSINNLLVTTGWNIQNIPTLGQLVGYTIEVVRPYTGVTAGDIIFDFYEVFPDNLQERVKIDLKTGGWRKTTQLANAGFTGVAGESVGANLSTDVFGNRAMSKFNLIASAMASADNGDLPIVNLKLEFSSPYIT